MGRFGGIRTTRTAGAGGNYFTNGLHLVRVDRIKSFTDGKRVDRTALEFTVLKTIQPGDADEAHKPGTEVSKLWDDRDVWFLGQFKQFVKVVLELGDDEAEEQITEEVCEKMSDEKTQPCAGVLLTVHGRPHRTQAGNLITATSFRQRVQPHEALELMGGDVDALKAAYREREGVKSLADFNRRAAESAKAAGVKFTPIT